MAATTMASPSSVGRLAELKAHVLKNKFVSRESLSDDKGFETRMKSSGSVNDRSHFSRFFFSGTSPGGEERMMLLSGPTGCGKTSLLFQFAFNCALGDRDVVFICNRRRMESNPPCLSQGIDPSSEVFKRIKMKYIEDDEGLKRYFAAFHLLKPFPAAVVIDDFGDFFDERCQKRYGNQRGRDIAMVRILSLCRDAISHANERLMESCKLLLADSHRGDNPRHLFIYKRWIPCIFTVQAEGDGSGTYTLRRFLESKTAASKTAAEYSIALQYLVLQRMIADADPKI